jgi:hypothetical protein
MNLDTKQNSKNSKLRTNINTQQNNDRHHFVFCLYYSKMLHAFRKSRCTASGKAGTSKTKQISLLTLKTIGAVWEQLLIYAPYSHCKHCNSHFINFVFRCSFVRSISTAVRNRTKFKWMFQVHFTYTSINISVHQAPKHIFCACSAVTSNVTGQNPGITHNGALKAIAYCTDNQSGPAR